MCFTSQVARMDYWTGLTNFGKTMIKMMVKEYREGDLGVNDIIIKFLGIPVFKYTKTTANYTVVALLTPKSKSNKVTGFRNEADNQGKKTQ